MWVSVSFSLNQIFEVFLNGGIWKLYRSSGKKSVTGTQSLRPGSRDASDCFPDVASLPPSGVVSWFPLKEISQTLRLTTLESTSYQRGKAYSRSRVHMLGKCIISTELSIVASLHIQFIDAWIRSEILRETFLVVFLNTGNIPLLTLRLLFPLHPVHLVSLIYLPARLLLKKTLLSTLCGLTRTPNKWSEMSKINAAALRSSLITKWFPGKKVLIKNVKMSSFRKTSF